MINFIIFSTVFFFAGQLLIFWFSSINGYGKKWWLFTCALLIRIFLTWYYYYRTLFFGGDAIGYYAYSKEIGLSNLAGIFSASSTEIIGIISAFFYQPASLFGNSYLMLYIPFSLIGFMGSLLLYRILDRLLFSKGLVNAFLAFFLPNIIFWTCNIGKDSIIFFAIIWLVSGLVLNKGKKIDFFGILSIFVSGFIIYLIRAHILIVFILAFISASFFENKKFAFKNIIIFTAIFFTFIFISNRLAGVLKLDTESEELAAYYEKGTRQLEVLSTYYESSDPLLNRGGAFSIPSAPLYGIVWLCFPFFWQASKFSHVFGIIDGLVYQFLLIYLLIHWKEILKDKILPYKYVWIIYVIIVSSIFGTFQLNFGLAVRQKIMVAPLIIILFAVTRFNIARKKDNYHDEMLSQKAGA